MLTGRTSTLRPPTTSTKGKYRPEIDGLRAFAVIAVIIYHFNKAVLPSGYLGVDIFFVISGYVITSSLLGRESGGFRDFITGFYERRIKRLVPALAVFVIITGIAISLVDPNPGLSLKTGMASLFGLSNIYLLEQSTDYFAQATELNTFTHTWSLGVEEQFYLLFPFLIWFSGFGRQTRNGARNLFLAVAALTIASVIGFLHLYHTNQQAAYFLMPIRFWEMAAGCLIFIGFHKRASVEKALEQVPPFLVLGAMVALMYAPMSWAAASTIGVVMLSAVLVASLKPGTAAFKFFTHKRVVYVGLISYSLYLWHWGVLSISRWTIGIHWWSVPFQLALILTLAVASYRWIETPLRRRAWFGTRWKTLLGGLAVLVAVSGGLAALGNPLKGRLYTGNYPYQQLITRSRNHLEEGSSAPRFSGDHCFTSNSEWGKKEFDYNNCFLPGKSSQTFFFAGNSHADHFRSLHYLLNKNAGVNVFSVSASVCVFPENPSQDGCDNSPQADIERKIFENAKAGDVLVISNRFGGRSSDLIEVINQVATKATSKGMKVVLFLPTPIMEKSIEQCAPNWFRPVATIPKDCFKELPQVEKEREYEVQLITSRLDPSILLFDPTLSVCSNGRCGIMDSQFRPLYADSNHFTDFASTEYIFNDFLAFLKKNNLLAQAAVQHLGG